ncbi:hypothetical protein AZE42_08652 [Rhizopogon vesiculosus]|uniref:Uncharacterized protein n=1 Tax=Rhizopogon vesiculosus TaxID=180088 RepID=A0A1J8PZE2_9AGAM|nr:hypothetical protein AZE42_08652 [Rhizopogon vesiculosus]
MRNHTLIRRHPCRLNYGSGHLTLTYVDKLITSCFATVIIDIAAVWKIQIHLPFSTVQNTPPRHDTKLRILVKGRPHRASQTAPSRARDKNNHNDDDNQTPKEHPLLNVKTIPFCIPSGYSGWEYNELTCRNGPTPLPTVEDVLFKAFVEAMLVDERGGLDGCGWEKCGRTDREVSAAGQAVSLAQSQATPSSSFAPEREETDTLDDLVTYVIEDTPQNISAPSQSSLRRELCYVSMLNRLLPPTIRVLAWSPISPDFSARFNCKHWHYKYFFTSHGLDLSLMQSAAARFIGELSVTCISPVDGDGENRIYVCDLMESAFLYHQVRHVFFSS